MEWYSLCPDKTGRFAIAFMFARPQQHSENNIPRRFWMYMYASLLHIIPICIIGIIFQDVNLTKVGMFMNCVLFIDGLFLCWLLFPVFFVVNHVLL